MNAGRTAPRLRVAVRLAFAQMRHRPMRAVTVALAVLLATACVVGILVLDGNTILTRQWFAVAAWGDPDLVVTFPSTTLSGGRRLVAQAKREDDVDAVLGILRSDRDATGSGLPVYLTDGDVGRFRFLEPLGEMRGETPIEGAILGSSADTDRAPRRIGEAPVRIVARARQRYFAGNQGAGGLFLPAVTPGLPEDLSVRPVLWLRTSRPDAVRARYEDRAMVQDAPHRTLWMGTEDSAMRASVKIASLLTLVLAAFVLAHVTRVGLLERSRELAVLRALGMPRRHVLGLGLLEVGIVALPAALAGVPLGSMMAHALGRSAISTLGRYMVWFMDFPVGTVALAVFAGVAIPMLGAWFSLRTVLRIDAAAALGPVFMASPPILRGRRWPDCLAGACAIAVGTMLASLLARVESPKVEGLLLPAAALVGAAIVLVVVLPPFVTPATSLLGMALSRAFGVMGRLAARTGAGAGRALRPAVVGVTGVFAIVLTLENLVRSMEQEIADWGRAALEGRAYVGLAQGLSGSRIERVRARLPGLVVLPVLGEWDRPLAIRAVDLSPLLGTGLLSEDEEAMVGAFGRGEGVVASGAFAIQYGLEVGDRPVLTTTMGARPGRILAITDRFGALPTDRAYLIASRGFAREHLGLPEDARPRRLVAWTRDGRDLEDDEIGRLRSALGPALERLSTGARKLEKRLEKTRRDFRIFDAIWGVLVVLATVGTVGTIGLRALERRRELALMRVLGTTRRQFRTYFMAQGFAIGLVGGILALLAAVPFTAGAVAGLREVSGMDVEFGYSATGAAVCLVLAVSLGTLAGALAYWRARGIDWAAALKYE